MPTWVFHNNRYLKFISRTYYPWLEVPMCTHFPTKFSDKRLPMVALVSFPSSGNSWLRFLVEGATGIFSGSVYKDARMSSGKDIFTPVKQSSSKWKFSLPVNFVKEANVTSSCSWILWRNVASQLRPYYCGQEPRFEVRHVRQVPRESHTLDQEPLQGSQVFSQPQVGRKTWWPCQESGWRPRRA